MMHTRTLTECLLLATKFTAIVLGSMALILAFLYGLGSAAEGIDNRYGTRWAVAFVAIIVILVLITVATVLCYEGGMV